MLCFVQSIKLEDLDWSLEMRHPRDTIISAIQFHKSWIKNVAMSVHVSEWKQAAPWLRRAQLMRFSVLCPVETTQQSGPCLGDAPPKGPHHLRNPIPKNMNQRHCIVRGHFSTAMSCLLAEKSLAALLMLSQATKTRNSGPVFGDAPPEGHHHLCNPILQNMNQDIAT